LPLTGRATLPEYLNKTAEIPLTCPKCGQEFIKTVGDLERDPQFFCPKDCGAVFDGAPFLEEAEKALKNAAATLQREIDKLNRRLC
jgi:hypothetical protein